MAKFEEKVEQLLEKHPHLSKAEAEKIVTGKNDRKKAKRNERQERAKSRAEKRHS